MKNQNPVLIAIVFALAFALAPVTKAAPALTVAYHRVTAHPDGCGIPDDHNS